MATDMTRAEKKMWKAVMKYLQTLEGWGSVKAITIDDIHIVPFEGVKPGCPWYRFNFLFKPDYRR